MWTVVYVAPDPETAEQMKEHLSTEGFLVKVRMAGAPRVCSSNCEVLVPESEAEEANELLLSKNWALGVR